MSQQLQITGGAKVRSLEGVITGSTGVLGSLPINGSNGIPQLDVNGKILVSQLPNSVMEYLGTWDAATNTPTLANGTGNAGDVYLCNVAGTVNFGAGPITFYVGDQVIYSGSIWQRASGATGSVTSVAVTETGDALTITGSPITTSGTINIGFAGTSAQYVAGDGTLVTFPALTGYVPYTGATATLDMGSFDVNARGFKVNGTAGSGHVDFKHQSGTPTGSASSTTLYADTNGDMAWKNDHNYITTFDSHSNTADRIYTLPNASGTVALTSDIPSVTNFVTLNTLQTIIGTKIYTSLQYYNNGVYLQEGTSGSSTGYTSLAGNTNGIKINLGTGTSNNNLNFASTTTGNTYTFPNATGTIALTTDLSSYVPTSRTLTINGTTYDLSADRSWTVSGSQWTTSGSDIYYNTGNVGINQSSPTYKLDVGGTGRFTGLISANAGIKAQYGRIDGRLFSTSDAEFGDMTSTTGCLSMSFDSTGQQGYLTSRNYATSTDKPLNYNASSHIFNGGKVSVSALDGESLKLQLATSTGNNYLRFYSSAGSGLGYVGSFYSGGTQLMLVDGSGTDLSLNGNANLLLRTGGTERMRINSSGNVGIGTTSPAHSLDVVKNAVNSIRIQNTGNNADAYLQVQNTTGNALFGINETGPYIYTGGAFATQFYTSGSERMRITSGGEVLINTSSSVASTWKLQVNSLIATLGTDAALVYQNRSDSTKFTFYATGGYSYFFNGGNVSQINMANGIYTPLSDINKKKDFEDSTIGLNAILGLKPKLFRMKTESNEVEKTLGFIAQEVKEHIPQAYVEQNDFIGLNDRPIIAALVNAIKELKAEIDELKNK